MSLAHASHATQTDDVLALQAEKASRLDRLSKKRQLLAQLLTQQVSVHVVHVAFACLLDVHGFDACNVTHAC